MTAPGRFISRGSDKPVKSTKKKPSLLESTDLKSEGREGRKGEKQGREGKH